MPLLPVLEFLFLISAMTAFTETGKRRGTNPWPFIVVALVGYCIVPAVTAFVISPHTVLFVKAGWLGLVYGSIFVFGGRGRRLSDSWQCPSCMLFNPPTTLVCPCGQVAEGFDPDLARKRTPELVLGIWPRVVDVESAGWATRQGVLAAILNIIIVLVAMVLALSVGNTLFLLDVAAVFVIFIPIAIGLYFKSRTAAVLGLVFQSISTLFQIVQMGLGVGFLPFFLVILFVGGVRGTFAYHRFKAETVELIPDLS